ncbi:penicillin-insensitive murein endopeptidase [Tranquillimonas rosea]|uniref:penicillin-insensitive murein endopeptidase n=1 Tax=Tranquillimonas rosea TaxID=641238 RepID=UPI003BAA25A4
MVTRILVCLTAALVLASCGSRDVRQVYATEPLQMPEVTRSGVAKNFFGQEASASQQSPAPYGFYSKGCLAGGVQLPETGPTWQAMRLSRNRNWGHPETIRFLQRLSQKVAGMNGTQGLYVGDISQPRGGPMTSGHSSHQIGLDADIWLRPVPRLDLTRSEREGFPPISMRRAKGAYTNSNWSPLQHEMVKAAAQDPAVARIFIFPGAKVSMCNTETGDRSWLRKVRPWGGHHYHFHIRLACPRGATDCTPQDPPPPGDGCAAAQEWVNNIIDPPPPDPNAPAPTPKSAIKMADLPQQCQAVLSPL